MVSVMRQVRGIYIWESATGALDGRCRQMLMNNSVASAVGGRARCVWPHRQSMLQRTDRSSSSGSSS